MALIANVRAGNVFLEQATLHIIGAVKRTADRRWRLEYEVTHKLERPFGGNGRLLLNEWAAQPGQQDRWRAYAAQTEADTGKAPTRMDWLNDTDAGAEFEAYRIDVMTNGIETYYERIPELSEAIEGDSVDTLWAEAYAALAARPEISQARSI